jgi:Poly (ADP-ribose) glycohydrolase (PARG)
MQQYPPHFSMARKKAVYQIVCPAGNVHSGQIAFSRYSALTLPLSNALPESIVTQCEARPDFFTYDSKINSHSVIIHTGFWGCGAYGGNRVLMTILQILAAQLAGVNCLVFHTGDEAGIWTYQDAENTLRQEKGNASNVTELINALQAGNFSWGVSDGN